MAKQKGVIKLEGTIGDITFFKSKDGFLARENNPVDGKRIATDPAFQRTRENGQEFGRAGKAGKLLRTAFRSMLQKAADSRMVSRLTAEMMKVIKADLTSTRGLRNVIDGEALLLKGFDFNEFGRLSTTLYAPYTTTVNRATGALTVNIPPFVPINMIAAPVGATHYRLMVAGAHVDFTTGDYEVDDVATTEQIIGAAPTAAQALTCNVTANGTMPLFLVLGVEFFQEVNGSLYSLKNGAFNALQIVEVDA
jgi:hypothetical protein